MINNPEMAPTKMDLITAAAQRELRAQAQLAGFFSDKSQFAGKGSKSVSFPKLILHRSRSCLWRGGR